MGVNGLPPEDPELLRLDERFNLVDEGVVGERLHTNRLLIRDHAPRMGTIVTSSST